MNTLLIAEHNNETLADATVKAVTAAAQMGGECHVLVAGSGCAAVADQAAKLDGVAKVLLADDGQYEKQLAEPMAALVVGMADNYATIASPASTNGKNFMPRIAALLDCSQISDITAVIDANTFERPIYAGNAIQTVKVTEAKKAVTIRSTAGVRDGSASVEAAGAADNPGLSEFVNEELTKSDCPELTSAKVVVSAGAACSQAIPPLEKVADKLGPLSVRRAPRLMPVLCPMIIKSGRPVKWWRLSFILLSAFPAPFSIWPVCRLKVIVAINKDEEAPIFRVADYGLVADLFTAVPELEEELGKAGL